MYKIFETLGLPSESDWPVNSVIPLKSFHSNVSLSNKSQSGAETIKRLIPALDKNALDLLMKLLDFNLNNRMTAKDALVHSFFTQQQAEDPHANYIENQIQYSTLLASNDACVNLEEKFCTEVKEKSQNVEMKENENPLSSLPDVTNLFQPNILKRKRIQQNK